MKRFYWILIVFSLIGLLACQTTGSVDSETVVEVKIINIPNDIIGSNAHVAIFPFIQNASPNRPTLEQNINDNIYSGHLSYEDGTLFKVKDVFRGERYIILFALLNDNRRVIDDKYSRPIYIRQGVILLDYSKDFYNTVQDAVRN